MAAEATLKEVVQVETATFTAVHAREVLGRTGCKVQVRSRGGPRMLTITGPPEQLMAARMQVLNILQGPWREHVASLELSYNYIAPG